MLGNLGNWSEQLHIHILNIQLQISKLLLEENRMLAAPRRDRRETYLPMLTSLVCSSSILSTTTFSLAIHHFFRIETVPINVQAVPKLCMKPPANPWNLIGLTSLKLDQILFLLPTYVTNFISEKSPLNTLMVEVAGLLQKQSIILR
jgi:hypothetical protein